MVINLRKNFKWISLAIAGVILLLIAFKIPVVQRSFYPMPYKSDTQKYAALFGIDPLLVTAVMREESRFMPKAQSGAGAMGLMQLMPETAQWAADKLPLQDYKEDQLLQPETNIMLGCWYLSNLSKQFNNNTILVLTAYNGGRGRLKEWLDNGDMSSKGRVEEIPLNETREYVRRVLDSYAKYQKLYPQ